MRRRTAGVDLFKGRHFDQEIIVLCVRWYLSFKLSSRDLVQIMSERGIALAHIKVRGRWTYLYRAVDKYGRTVDFLLSERRHVGAAKRFFIRAIRHNRTPRVITLDGYAASHRAIRELKSTGRMCRRLRVRSCKYLNNVVEQDHRRVKQRIGPMLGFKRFDRRQLRSAVLSWRKRSRKRSFKSESCPSASPQRPQSGRHYSPYNRIRDRQRQLTVYIDHELHQNRQFLAYNRAMLGATAEHRASCPVCGNPIDQSELVTSFLFPKDLGHTMDV